MWLARAALAVVVAFALIRVDRDDRPGRTVVERDGQRFVERL
jgi:hypothetical protein